jgi:monofunctional biosynthetic peptidoglycan transglycosylase
MVRRKLVVFVLALLLLVGVAGGYQLATWPDVAALTDRDPTTSAFIEAYRRRAAREELPAPIMTWVPYRAIASDLKQAVLVAEDIDFFSHHGFAPDEIEAALRDTLERGRPLRGASTITQQLAKNLWLSPSRSPWRKLKEAILTWQLERELSKRRILELYLNLVELGPGVYGVEAAARRYFHRSAAQLGPAESAQLAAALPDPPHWHPGSTDRRYLRRVERIRGRMRHARWILKLL